MLDIGGFFHAVGYMRRQLGWRAAISLLVVPVFELHRAFAYRRSFTEPIKVPPLDSNLIVRLAMPADRQLLETIYPPFRVKRLLKKMEAGERCMLAVYQNRVVGVNWAGFADGPSVRDTALRIKADEAYVWGAFVVPEFRSRNIHTALLDSLMVGLKEQGYAATYFMIDRSNVPSRKVGKKAGGELVGEIFSIRILKWKYKRYKSHVGVETLVPESQNAV